MNSLSSQIEALILQYDHRGMAQLRHNLKPGYCQRSAELLLNNKGIVLIDTGFPVSGSFERDGAIALIVSVERPGVAADGRYYNMHRDGITRGPESTEDGFPLRAGISIIRQIHKLISAQKKNQNRRLS